MLGFTDNDKNMLGAGAVEQEESIKFKLEVVECP